MNTSIVIAEQSRELDILARLIETLERENDTQDLPLVNGLYDLLYDINAALFIRGADSVILKVVKPNVRPLETGLPLLHAPIGTSVHLRSDLRQRGIVVAYLGTNTYVVEFSATVRRNLGSDEIVAGFNLGDEVIVDGNFAASDRVMQILVNNGAVGKITRVLKGLYRVSYNDGSLDIDNISVEFLRHA